MKRLFAILLALSLALTFTACVVIEDGEGGSESTKAPASQSGETQGTEGTPSTTASDTVSFEEMVVVDNEHCTIKITGFEKDIIWGYTLNVYLENKSSDKTFMFTTLTAAINGVTVVPVFSAQVAPGKKANERIIFTAEELEEHGVGDYTDIELSFSVSDSNDWMADPVAQELVHVYPYGEENAVKYVRQSQPDDLVLVDNDYVTVTVIGYEHDQIWGQCVNLFVVNKTEASLMVTADETSVNGFMLDPYFAEVVTAGNCSFTFMYWTDSTLEQNSIKDIESIEFILKVQDAENWFSEAYVSQNVTLNP